MQLSLFTKKVSFDELIFGGIILTFITSQSLIWGSSLSVLSCSDVRTEAKK